MTSSHARLRRTIAGLLAFAPLALARPAHAQGNLSKFIKQQGEDNVSGYVGPLSDLLIANLNTAYYHSARLPRTGLGVSLDIVGMVSKIGDAQKTFVATSPTGFTPSTFTTATILGGTGTEITSPQGTKYRGSDGLIIATYLPFAIPQVRVATLGTEVIVRYVPTLTFGDVGDETSAGITSYGGRHSVSQYFAGFPVDLTVGAMYNSIKVDGEVSINVTTLTYGVQASKNFSILTLYGGAGSENGKMHLVYDSSDLNNPDHVDINLDVERHFRETAGAALRLGFLSLFADANFGTVTTYSGGLRLGGY
jgi:hypothetical protein